MAARLIPRPELHLAVIVCDDDHAVWTVDAQEGHHLRGDF